MRSSAAVATSSLIAATAATGSPTNRTLPCARACSSWLTGRMPKGIGRSLPVSTACTPGRARAREASMARMRACAWVERSSLANSMRGRNRSSANFVAPVTLAVASTLRRALPTIRNSWATAAFFLPPAIQTLRRRPRILAAQEGRGQFDGLVDLDVAGAAAEVAREGGLDVVAGGPRVVAQQGEGGEEERRGAVAALRRAQLGEGVLKGVESAAVSHPLHGLDPPAGAGEPEDQAGEHRAAVQQHRTGAAFAQLAAVLGAGEPEVLPQHFEEGLVRGEGHLDLLPVQLEGDLRLGRGHQPFSRYFSPQAIG